MAFKFTQTGAEIQAILDNAASQNDVQNAIYASMITDTASGSIASFADGAAVPVADMTVNLDYNAAGWTGANIYVRGFNLWDEQTEKGSFNPSTGEKQSGSNLISANKTPLKPSLSYCFHAGTARVSQTYWYALDGSYIENISNASDPDRVITAANNAHFVNIHLPGGYGLVYLNNVSVNYPSTETAYHAYVGQDYAINFGRTIYGGTLDPITGKLTSTKAADGTDITPVEYDITPVPITALYGQNNIFADTGDISVTYRADTKLYIAKVV